MFENESNTKLILIEGIPGAGKTTSCKHLGRTLQQQGIAAVGILKKMIHIPLIAPISN